MVYISTVLLALAVNSVVSWSFLESDLFQLVMLWIAGVVMLVAVPLLAREYYHWATVYEGYFHLGLGAYLVVLAYVCIGSSLLRQFAGKQQAEPRTPEPGNV